MNMNIRNIVEIATILVAILALGLTIYESHLEREHVRKSVQPVIRLDVLVGPNRDAGVFMKNVGLGPARIKKITGFADNGKFDLTKAEGMVSALGLLLSSYDVGVDAVPYIAFDENDFLSNEGENEIELIDLDALSHEQRLKIANDLDITVEYVSIYDEEVYFAQHQ